MENSNQSPEQLFHDHQHLATATLYRTLGQPHNVAKSKLIEYEDLLQVTYIGLWKACTTYSPSKGKFKSHAINHMKWTLLPALNNDFNTFKYASNNTPEEEYELASMDAEIGLNGDSSRTMHESIAAEVIDDIESTIIHKSEVEEAMGLLNERQREIVELKSMGWYDADIGKQLGISKQAVNQGYNNIIKKMREIGEIA
ncbi:sigma-70 family RNA polymerase sigma factor [Virgibacillus profundi]|uniref:sigma-70 family RNA polymerase sigma factor n=1 Tax=Virgibacillus profundi TaxID=2024555 RepID=UPI0013FD3122|nr:sigma-70 family RNA polymerase sigma factor [Virgibacillus profundi]